MMYHLLPVCPHGNSIIYDYICPEDVYTLSYYYSVDNDCAIVNLLGTCHLQKSLIQQLLQQSYQTQAEITICSTNKNNKILLPLFYCVRNQFPPILLLYQSVQTQLYLLVLSI